MEVSADVVVVGGGIVGVATARELARTTRASVVVAEAEDRLAPHQTGNNSGVIHAGLYYRPGSLKARNCVEGRQALMRFCEQRGVPFEVCGKVVVATSPDQLPALEELERRGLANGLEGLRRLSPEEISEHEPHASGVAGLWVPQTGIVDYRRVTEALADDLVELGGEVRTSCRVVGIGRADDGLAVTTEGGEIRCRGLVNCAGLQSDRVARLAGVNPEVRIVPFRGEYYELVPERHDLVHGLIYPVPDPGFPFLGVHFTRLIDGGVEAGPNAVLALEREGYSRTSFSLRDACSTFGFPGFWRLARRYWRTGLAEQWRSWSRRAFVRSLQQLVPEIRPQDVRRGGAGVRAQALGADGALTDDFRIVHGERTVHVLNAPSPAATASIAIGRTIVAAVTDRFELSATN